MANRATTPRDAVPSRYSSRGDQQGTARRGEPVTADWTGTGATVAVGQAHPLPRRRRTAGLAIGLAAAAALTGGFLLARRGARERGEGLLPRASAPDQIAATGKVLITQLAKGPIIRRAPMVALAERFELDMVGVREMQRLRRKYGSGPVLLRNPLRPNRFIAMVLAPEDVRRTLAQTPEPFATWTREKYGSLAHFQPRFSLISTGEKRERRVQFNRQVLDSREAAHRMSNHFLRVLDEESHRIRVAARERGELIWDEFNEGWFRIVRRVVFGDGAASDRELIDMIERLRRRGNWSLTAPPNRDLRERFLTRVRHHLGRGEPGSISELIANMEWSPDVYPEHQVPQWLFAFDPAGMATFRALALLASHPRQMAHARREVESDDPGIRKRLPFLRAAVLESLRLWPTAPLVLRESLVETEWDHGTMPEHTLIVNFANFLHRDDENLAYAHRFEPDVWLEYEPLEQMPTMGDGDWPLIPFSSGNGVCPGRHLVLMLTSNMLRSLLERHDYSVVSGRKLDPSRPMPGTLSHFHLRFSVRPA